MKNIYFRIDGLNSSSIGLSKLVAMARDIGASFYHEDFFNVLLSSFLRKCLSFFVHVLAKLSSLNAFFHIFFGLPSIIRLMPMVIVTSAVFRHVFLFFVVFIFFGYSN